MSLFDSHLSIVRQDGQHSQLYIALLQPSTVFTCRVDDTFTTDNMIAEFEYDGGVGTYGDILPDMVAWIGTAAGLFDVGIVRIRKAAGATTMYVAEVSEINWSNNLFVTVVDDMAYLAPRHLRIDTDHTPLMDYDIDFSDQHLDFDPVPVLGSHAVAWLEGATVDVSFDASSSWVIDSTISTYSWASESSAGVSFDNDASATPTVTFSAAGTFRISCEVTSTNGKSFTGHRYVFVFDDDNPPYSFDSDGFTLDNCSGVVENGGWSFAFTLNDPSILQNAYNGALCILFAKDWYAGTEGSVGLNADRENILAIGYIAREESDESAEQDYYKLEVQGAQWWLSRMFSFPMGVEFKSFPPGEWDEIEDLTVDKGIWHFLHWRTTVTAVMDVLLSGNTLLTTRAESPANTIWEQIRDIASQILAEPICTHLGGLNVQVPYNLTPEADRGSFLDIVTIESQDRVSGISVELSSVSVSQVNLSGVAVDSEGDGLAIFSLAPGNIPKRVGAVEIFNRVLLEDQDQSNLFASLVLNNLNNPYKDIPTELTYNMRAFDISPVQFGAITTNAYTGVVLPQQINYSYNSKNGKLSVEVSFAAEVVEGLSVDGVNGEIPDGSGGFLPISGLPPLPNLQPQIVEFPDIPITFPGVYQPEVTTPCSSTQFNRFPLVWSRNLLDGRYSDKLSAFAYISCVIRDSGISRIHVAGFWGGDAAWNYQVYGIKDGVRVISASVTGSRFGNIATFDPVSETEVDSFEISLTSGLGTSTSYQALDVIGNGTVQADSEPGILITGMTEGKAYAIDGTGGPWTWGPPNVGQNYHFGLNQSGRIGWDYSSGGAFVLTTPAIALYSEQISGKLGRTYLIKTDADVYFQCVDVLEQSDNQGTMSYFLRNANIFGRYIRLGQATLQDVCAA